MKNAIILVCLLFSSFAGYSQVGIGTKNPDTTSVLDLSSTTKGLLIPRMTTSQRNHIAAPATGLQLFNLDDNCLDMYDGTKWLQLGKSQPIGNSRSVNDEIWTLVGDHAYAVPPGNIGIGVTNPAHKIDIHTGSPRSGTHAVGPLPLYVTGDIGESSNGMEFRHSDGTQGIGIGSTTLYAAGSNANQNLGLMAKGTTGNITFSGSQNSTNSEFMRITGTGRVGINTTTPNALLHVDRGSVIFTAPETFLNLFSTPPVSGAGIRMMWYAERAAFRVGLVDGLQWNQSNIGTSSFASGFNTIASGAQSFASGYNTKAIGDLSNSFGYFTKASGSGSFAAGESTIANTPGQFAIGSYNDTTAINYLWSAQDHLFSIGNGTSNSGRRNALTVLKGGQVGINTSSPDALLHVDKGSVVFTGLANLNLVPPPPVSGAGIRMMWYPERAAFRAGYVQTVQWDQSKIGLMSFASGHNTIASGYGSVATGNETNAWGDYSTAGGDFSFATGKASTAFGSLGWASGDYTFASGYFSQAFGNSSFASGQETRAIGANSYTSGKSTRASGSTSFAGGESTIANTPGLFAIGRFNDTTAINNNWSDNDHLFVIGNGTVSNRKNALTVLKSGNIGINTSIPKTRLHITGGTNAGLGETTGYAVLGSTTGTNLVLDDNEILARNNGAVANLILQEEGGNVGIGTSTPATRLQIANGTDAYWTDNSGYLVLGETSTTNIVMDNNEITARNNGWISTLFMQADGGGVRIGGNTPTNYQLELSSNNAAKPGTPVWIVPSDARLKKDIEPFTDGLDLVRKINPIWFRYNGLNGITEKGRFVGIIAQQIQKIAPYMISTTKSEERDGESYLSYDANAMTYILINAVKEQQILIDSLQQENAALQNKYDTSISDMQQKLMQMEAMINKLTAERKP